MISSISKKVYTLELTKMHLKDDLIGKVRKLPPCWTSSANLSKYSFPCPDPLC